jgi:hypothetical protein
MGLRPPKWKPGHTHKFFIYCSPFATRRQVFPWPQNQPAKSLIGFRFSVLAAAGFCGAANARRAFTTKDFAGEVSVTG